MDILTTWLFLAFVVERVTELVLDMFPGIREWKATATQQIKALEKNVFKNASLHDQKEGGDMRLYGGRKQRKAKKKRHFADYMVFLSIIAVTGFTVAATGVLFTALNFFLK